MFRLLFVLLALLLATPAIAAPIHFSVAASMTDAARALASRFEADGGAPVQINAASSGTLARQIAEGAPADLFVSANPAWVDYLVAQGRVAPETVSPFAGNALVFVGRPTPEVTQLSDLTRLRTFATGSPKSVPAGQYAEQALQRAGLLTQLAERRILARDVRQALLYADRGEVDGAFVYRTDARLARQTVILFEVPQELYAPIRYPLALTRDGAAKPEAVAFFTFLRGAVAAQILETYGFVPRAGAAGAAR